MKSKNSTRTRYFRKRIIKSIFKKQKNVSKIDYFDLLRFIGAEFLAKCQQQKVAKLDK